MYHLEWHGPDHHWAIVTDNRTVVRTSPCLSVLRAWLDHTSIHDDIVQYTSQVMAQIHRQRVIAAVLNLRRARRDERERNRKPK